MIFQKTLNARGVVGVVGGAATAVAVAGVQSFFGKSLSIVVKMLLLRLNTNTLGNKQ